MQEYWLVVEEEVVGGARMVAERKVQEKVMAMSGFQQWCDRMTTMRRRRRRRTRTRTTTKRTLLDYLAEWRAIVSSEYLT